MMRAGMHDRKEQRPSEFAVVLLAIIACKAKKPSTITDMRWCRYFLVDAKFRYRYY